MRAYKQVSVDSEPKFAKNSAFNKDFGSDADDVTSGADARLSDARTPTAHDHVVDDITDFDPGDYLNLTSTQSIGGAKTFVNALIADGSFRTDDLRTNDSTFIFTSAPIRYSTATLASIVNDSELINKGYVDDLDDKNVKDTGDQAIGGVKTFTSDIVVQGDAYVEGEFNAISSNDVNIGDRIITLNSEIEDTSAPSLNAGVEIARGTQDNAQLLWDESIDQWVAGVVGALLALATEDYVDDNFLPLDGGTIDGNLDLDGNLSIDRTGVTPNFSMQIEGVNSMGLFAYPASILLRNFDASGNVVAEMRMFSGYTLFDEEVRGPDPVNDAAYTPKSYVEDNFLSLDGGAIEGDLTLNNPTIAPNFILTRNDTNAFRLSALNGYTELAAFDSSGVASNYLRLFNTAIIATKEVRGPDPVDDSAYTPKSYVEDNFLKLIDNQEVDGIKTFDTLNTRILGDSGSNYVRVTGPLRYEADALTGFTSNSNHLVPKYYVDDNTNVVQQPSAYEMVMPSGVPSVGQQLQVASVSGSVVQMAWV